MALRYLKTLLYTPQFLNSIIHVSCIWIDSKYKSELMLYLEYINDMMLRIPKFGCIIMLGFGIRSIILEIHIKKLPFNTAVLSILFFCIIDCSDVVSVLSAFEADFLNVCISFCFSFFVCCACCCYTENSAA